MFQDGYADWDACLPPVGFLVSLVNGLIRPIGYTYDIYIILSGRTTLRFQATTLQYVEKQLWKMENGKLHYSGLDVFPPPPLHHIYTSSHVGMCK